MMGNACLDSSLSAVESPVRTPHILGKMAGMVKSDRLLNSQSSLLFNHHTLQFRIPLEKTTHGLLRIIQ